MHVMHFLVLSSILSPVFFAFLLASYLFTFICYCLLMNTASLSGHPGTGGRGKERRKHFKQTSKQAGRFQMFRGSQVFFFLLGAGGGTTWNSAVPKRGESVPDSCHFRKQSSPHQLLPANYSNTFLGVLHLRYKWDFLPRWD